MTDREIENQYLNLKLIKTCPGPLHTQNMKYRLDLIDPYYLITPYNKTENILVSEKIERIHEMGYTLVEYTSNTYDIKVARKLLNLTFGAICVKIKGWNTSERVEKELEYAYAKCIPIYSVDLESISRDFNNFKR